MENGYSSEKSIQILVALLKAHGIKKVIVSPGNTNVTFVGSIQYDPYFEIYSCIDERSAAYMACGLAEETGEPVCLSCTGATASRNYMPALTEAFYRKLPVIAITSSQYNGRVGHLVAQVTNRNEPPEDVVKCSVMLPFVRDARDFWSCQAMVNSALLEARKDGGGPVHINLQTDYSRRFDVLELPDVRVVERISVLDEFPLFPEKKAAIFIGSHQMINLRLQRAIEKFCEKYNAVVFCDHTSGYNGKYKLLYSLVAAQSVSIKDLPEILIHLGEISGDYYTLGCRGEEVWRVNEDGKVRDTFARLRYVFDMPEVMFFEHYAKAETNFEINTPYFESCKKQIGELYEKIPELPFSNIWIAQQTAKRIPQSSVVHLGILNSLRSWNFFQFPDSVRSASNVGGFGIDGGMSALIGASLADKERLYFLVIGDLAFFYDINILGNRHIKNNVRILLINNGVGVEMRIHHNVAAQFEEDSDEYMSAGGHFANKSAKLVKDFAEDLGFKYLSATNKREYLKALEEFVDPNNSPQSIVFEVFTEVNNEDKAYDIIKGLNSIV